MASWSETQRQRLAAEKESFRRELPDFIWYDLAEAQSTSIRGTYTTSAGSTYSLYVHIGSGYPLTLPSLYITSPNPLYGYGSKTVQSYGTSHAMHVWQSDWNGNVKICHCKTEYWSQSDTLIEVMMKGMLWLEAFEAHKQTGQSIDHYSLTYR